MQALQHTLQMKETTLSFLDAQIEAARSNLEILSIPYHDLRQRFESAQSAFLAAKENHEDLMNQRAALDNSMLHLHALLHPLRRFEEHILGKIFLFAVEMEREKDHNRPEPPRLRRPQAIILISKVCSKWRRAAQSVPELWTYVRLNLSRRIHVHEKLAYFLNLARGLPMDVSTSNLQPGFFGTSEDSEDEEGGVNALPLLSSVKNLRSLTANYTHYRALQFLPSLGTDCLDTLEELHLRSEPLSSPASGLFSIASYLSEAPNLRVLRLMHVHLLPPAAHESVPNVKLEKVKELVMYGPMTHGTEIFGFAQVVGMLPNVEKVTFIQNDTVPFNLMGGDDVTLGRLTELTTNYVALEHALRSSFGAQTGSGASLQPPPPINMGLPNLPGQNQNQNQGQGKITAPKLEKLTVMDTPNPTSGLIHFLKSVETVKTLSFLGNFDPFSSIIYPGPGVQGFNGGMGMGMGMGGPIILPAQGGLFPPIPQPIGQGQGNNGTGSGGNGGTAAGNELLTAMKSIESLEIVNAHPRFVEALYAIIDVEEEEQKTHEESNADQENEDTGNDDQDKPDDPKGKGKAVDRSEKQDENQKSTKPKSKPRTRKAFQYLPNLKRLEITISKMFPLNRRDFEALFEARCLQDLRPTTDMKTGDKHEQIPPSLPSLEKLEVHLGSGLDEEIIVAVGTRMELDGEEKGSRWFSWTNPNFKRGNEA